MARPGFLRHMLEIYEIPVTPFMQNCTLLVCSETKDAAVCDCGDAGPVLQKIEQLGVKVTKVIATHGHLDHIGGTADLMQALQIPFWFPRGDDFLREGLVEQARMYGFPPVQVPSVDVDIVAGMDLMIGNCKLEVLPCPGHTPGHVVFYDSVDHQMVAGDVLFQGSVGRTDFPFSNPDDLVESIQTQIYTLEPTTVVHCGHGPTTTIGEEARSNPFVRAK